MAGPQFEEPEITLKRRTVEPKPTFTGQPIKTALKAALPFARPVGLGRPFAGKRHPVEKIQTELTQPAFKYAATWGHPEEKRQELSKKEWPDVYRELWGIDPASKEGRSTLAQFWPEVAGDVTGMLSKPETWITWKGLEKAVPIALRGVWKKLPPNLKQSLLKERFAWGQSPIEKAYKEFGLKPGASPEEVTKAYRSAVLKWHPDRAPTGQVVKYTRKFIKGQGAFDRIQKATAISGEAAKVAKRPPLAAPPEAPPPKPFAGRAVAPVEPAPPVAKAPLMPPVAKVPGVTPPPIAPTKPIVVPKRVIPEPTKPPTFEGKAIRPPIDEFLPIKPKGEVAFKKGQSVYWTQEGKVIEGRVAEGEAALGNVVVRQKGKANRFPFPSDRLFKTRAEAQGKPIVVPKPPAVAPTKPPVFEGKAIEPAKPKEIKIQDNLEKITEQTYHLEYISVPRELQRQGLATKELQQRIIKAQAQGAKFFTVRGMTESGERLVKRLEAMGIITKKGTRPGVYSITPTPPAFKGKAVVSIKPTITPKFKGVVQAPETLDTTRENPVVTPLRNKMVPLGNTQGAKVRHAKYYLQNFRHLISRALDTNKHVRDVFGRSGTLSRIMDMIKPKGVKHTISDLDKGVIQHHKFTKSDPQGVIQGYQGAKEALLRLLSSKTGLSVEAFRGKQQFRKEFFALPKEAQMKFNQIANKTANEFFRSTSNRLAVGINAAEDAGQWLFINRTGGRGQEKVQGIFNMAGFLKGEKLAEDPAFDVEAAVKSMSRFLQKADVKTADAFGEIAASTGGNFWVVDPPYVEEAGYRVQETAWNIKDAEKLAKALDKAHRTKGDDFTYHDTYHPDLVKLWEGLGYRTHKIRVISKGKGVPYKDELFVTSVEGVGEPGELPVLKGPREVKIEEVERQLAEARAGQVEFEVKRLEKKLAQLRKAPPEKPPTKPPVAVAGVPEEEPFEELMKFFGEKAVPLKVSDKIPGLTVEETANYEKALAIAATEEIEHNLFAAIKGLGGIKKYREGFLEEELAPIPKHLINNKTGQYLDEIITELRTQGFHFEDDNDFIEAIKSFKKLQKGKTLELKEAKRILRELNRRIRKHTIYTERYIQRIGKLMARKMPVADIKKTINEVIMRQRTGKPILESEAYKRMMKKIDVETKRSWKVAELLAEERVRAEFAEKMGIKRDMEAARQETKQIIKDISKISTANLPVGYKEKVQEIIDPFDLKRRIDRTIARRDSMKNFVERMREQGKEIYIPQEQLDMLEKITLNEMTLEQLRETHEVIKGLYRQGMAHKQLLSHKEARDFAKVEKQITDRVYETGKKTPTVSHLKTPSERKRGLIQKVTNAIDAYAAHMRKTEFIARALDGFKGGVIQDNIIEPVQQAYNKEALKQTDVYTKLGKAIEPVSKQFKKMSTKQYSVEGVPQKFTKLEAMAVYANSLSPINKEYGLIRGWGWSPEQIDSIINSLTPIEKKFADDVIDVVRDLHSGTKEVGLKLTGMRVGEREGYWPKKTDRELSARAMLRLKQQDLFQDVMKYTYVERGFIKEIGKVSEPVSLDFLGVALSHINNVIHFQTHALAVRDVQKLIHSPVIKQAITDVMGENIYRQFAPWLREIANPKNISTDPIDKWAGRLKKNATGVTLGLKVSVALKQGGSFSQTIHEIGLADATRGFFEFYAHPVENTKFIYDKSPQMKFRRKTWDRDVREYLKSAEVQRLTQGKPGAQEILFSLIMTVDKGATLPSWYGAYHKHFRANKNVEAAIRYADGVVRRTQPAGSVKDLAAIMRGKNFKKLFTMFYTHFTNAYNQMANEALRLRWGTDALPKRMVDAMVAYWWLLIVPGVFAAEVWKLGKAKTKDIIKGIASYGMSSIAIIGNIANSIINSQFDYEPSAAFGLPKEIQKTFKGKKPRTKLKHAIRATGYATGLPMQQAWITMSGLFDLWRGETTDLRRLILSKYQLEGEKKPTVKRRKLFTGKAFKPTKFKSKKFGGAKF